MPEPTLRDRYEAAIRATWDGATMHMDDAIRTETDAVLAVRDAELEQLRWERDQLREALATVTGQCRGLEGQLVAARSAIDRVRAVADSLAANGRLGVDLEADGIRRGVADQLHAALDQSPNGKPSAAS